MAFTPEPTKLANRAKANDWLNKAVKMEEEGKSARMIQMALDRAVEFENASV